MTSNKPKVIRSWQVVRRGKDLVLEASGWLPGYTPAHRSTPKEAVAAAWEKHREGRLQMFRDSSDLVRISQALIEEEVEDDEGI